MNSAQTRINQKALATKGKVNNSRINQKKNMQAAKKKNLLDADREMMGYDLIDLDDEGEPGSIDFKTFM
jgi:hypothetical protein